MNLTTFGLSYNYVMCVSQNVSSYPTSCPISYDFENINLKLVFCLLLPFVSMYLFFRQDRIDYKKRLEQDRKGDEHMLREMKRFLDEKGRDTGFLDEALKEYEK